MNTTRIILTGAPGSGKTSISRRLKEEGYSTYPEVASDLIAAGMVAPVNGSDDKVSFPDLVLSSRIEHHKKSESLELSFFDRGIPDSLGFTYFLNKLAGNELLNAISEYRYNCVIAFPPWKSIYHTTEIRKEDFETATKIYQNILKGYKESGYNPIIIPCMSIDERLKFIKNLILKFKNS